MAQEEGGRDTGVWKIFFIVPNSQELTITNNCLSKQSGVEKNFFLLFTFDLKFLDLQKKVT